MADTFEGRQRTQRKGGRLHVTTLYVIVGIEIKHLNELFSIVRLRLERTLEAQTESNRVGRHSYRNRFQTFSKYLVKNYPITVRFYMLPCFTTSISRRFSKICCKKRPDRFIYVT